MSTHTNILSQFEQNGLTTSIAQTKKQKRTYSVKLYISLWRINNSTYNLPNVCQKQQHKTVLIKHWTKKGIVKWPEHRILLLLQLIFHEPHDLLCLRTKIMIQIISINKKNCPVYHGKLIIAVKEIQENSKMFRI